MYYPEELIEEVRQQNDIVNVISSYVKLQKKGSTYFGLCPFHNEKTPSFSVSASKQIYYCFGCGEGGNVISFLMKYENYSFVEAVKNLADRAGIRLPEHEYTPGEKHKRDLKKSIMEINREAAKYFIYSLKSEHGIRAYEYFRKRELSDETIKKFGLGYCIKQSSLLYDHLKKKGFNDEEIKESGLFTFSEKGVFCKFYNRAMFPIIDVNSRVIGFGGRVMGEGEPKYLNSPETLLFDKSRNLYGLNYARSSKVGYILLCEGYMDVIALHQAGFDNAVASLGTSLTMQQATLIKRYSDEVYITYDSDGAGRNAALRAIPILRGAGIKVKVVNMKPYKDPDEFIKAMGREEYEKRIREARNGFLFGTDCLREKTDLNDPDDKSRFYEEIAARLFEIHDEIQRNVYIDTVSGEYGIQKELLESRIKRMALGYDKKPAHTKADETNAGVGNIEKKSRDAGLIQAQKILITWLINNPEMYGRIAEYISEEDFTDGTYRKVADILFRQLSEGTGQVNPAGIISCFENGEEHREAASLFNAQLREDMTDIEWEKAINEAFEKIKLNSLNSRSRTAETIEEKQAVLTERKMLKNFKIKL